MIALCIICLILRTLCTLNCKALVSGYFSIADEVFPICKNREINKITFYRESQGLDSKDSISTKTVDYDYCNKVIHGVIKYWDFYNLGVLLREKCAGYPNCVSLEFKIDDWSDPKTEVLKLKLENFQKDSLSMACNYKSVTFLEFYLKYCIKNVLRPSLLRLINVFRYDTLNIESQVEHWNDSLKLTTFRTSCSCYEFIVNNFAELTEDNEADLLSWDSVIGQIFYDKDHFKAWKQIKDCIDFVNFMTAMETTCNIKPKGVPVPNNFDIKWQNVLLIKIDHIEILELEREKITILCTSEDNNEIDLDQEQFWVVKNNICIPISELTRPKIKKIIVSYSGLVSDPITLGNDGSTIWIIKKAL